MSNWAAFGNLVHRAHALGVFDDFSRRFKRLRRSGLDPQVAGEKALREAGDAGNPGAPAKVIYLKHWRGRQR